MTSPVTRTTEARYGRTLLLVEKGCHNSRFVSDLDTATAIGGEGSGFDRVDLDGISRRGSESRRLRRDVGVEYGSFELQQSGLPDTAVAPSESKGRV